jgi:hypothetical protein
MPGDVFYKTRGSDELVLAGHEYDRLNLRRHEPVGVGEVEFEFKIAEFTQATDDCGRAMVPGELDGEAFE